MRLLVCGTRISNPDKLKSYEVVVKDILLSYASAVDNLEIVEGCCLNSADQFAELFALEHDLKVHHFPSHAGNYLQRNIEMVELADEVLAFFDSYSYGTAHTIATAVRLKKPVKVIDIGRGRL